MCFSRSFQCTASHSLGEMVWRSRRAYLRHNSINLSLISHIFLIILSKWGTQGIQPPRITIVCCSLFVFIALPPQIVFSLPKKIYVPGVFFLEYETVYEWEDIQDPWFLPPRNTMVTYFLGPRVLGHGWTRVPQNTLLESVLSDFQGCIIAGVVIPQLLVTQGRAFIKPQAKEGKEQGSQDQALSEVGYCVISAYLFQSMQPP